ncbi:MAG: PKD domain-containing protein [Crocinitomicaceae bacterium]
MVILIGLLVTLSACKKEPAAPLPVGNFFVDNANCTTPCFVHCYDQSYNAVAWKWNFGNSLTSDKQQDSIQYHTPGFYTISLTVWNSDNVSDSLSKTIQVY